MCKSFSIFIIILCFKGSSLFAQNIEIGAFAGANSSIVGVRSEYGISEDGKSKPVISYNTGVYLSSINQGKFGLTGSIEYLRIQNKIKNGIEITDINGESFGAFDKSIINHYITLSTLGKIQLTKKLYAGIGVSENFLCKSVLKLNKDFIDYNFERKNYGKKFTNYYYKRFVVSIPVIIGLKLNQFDVFLRFNKAVMNRIKKDSYVKEYENTLILGLGYRFVKI